jgi:predicted Zn-dependent protease
VRRAGPALAALAVAALAACHEGVGPGQCFEPNVQAYGFTLGGDSALVFHWPPSYMPVRVYAEPTGDLPANAGAAMALWANAFRCGEMSLTLVPDSAQADIVMRNPTDLPAGAPGAPVVYADSVGACSGVTQFDTSGMTVLRPIRSFVAPVPGSDSASAAACYHFVTAHELGHALGLLQHSPDTGDLMYTTPRRRMLSEADRYTIQLLYHTTATLRPSPR